MADATTISCPKCGSDVETRDAEPLSRVPCPNCGERVRAARRFDHFELLETVGTGGMGTVYKARDIRLERDVALKLLRKDLGPEYADQLQQEARVTASINHPNVVQVFSFGHDHDQYYLVMELVERGTLDDLIAEQEKLSEDDVLRAGAEVARGLRAAFRKGLIHHDVKPANILFNGEGVAKISDFGLAGIAQPQVRGGTIWGTPYYVAPERLNNEPEDLRSDIYSLGATLFHAAAGRPPFEGETTSAAELRTLKTKTVKLATVAPNISNATANIIDRMISPEPRLRFSCYDDLIQALERSRRILAGQAESARAKFALLTLALILSVIAVGGWLTLSRRHAPAVEAPIVRKSDRGRQLGQVRPVTESGRSEKVTPGKEREAVLARETRLWNGAVEKFRQAVSVYDYQRAADAVKSAPLKEPSLRETQSKHLQIATWLHEWKTTLMRDLNARGYNGALSANNLQYSGISGATPDKLKLKMPHGVGETDWVKISPTTFLAISSSFANNPDRQWRCGVFAWSIGQNASAEQLFDLACAAKPAYAAPRKFFEQSER